MYASCVNACIRLCVHVCLHVSGVWVGACMHECVRVCMGMPVCACVRACCSTLLRPQYMSLSKLMNYYFQLILVSGFSGLYTFIYM